MSSHLRALRIGLAGLALLGALTGVPRGWTHDEAADAAAAA